MLLEPFPGFFGGVLGVIVLLEDDIFHLLAMISQALLELIFQDLHIKVCIHCAFNSGGKANPFPQHAAPYHEGTTPMFDSGVH
jgi:hypothetical protein